MEKSETPEKLEKVEKPFIHPQPILKYQPSYRLEPVNRFDSYVVEKLLKVFMDKKMKVYEEFDEETSVTLCRSLSEEIMSQIKLQKFDRYKIIAVVTIGEKLMQSFNHCAKFLWNSETDGYATYSYSTPNLFAVATVYAFYYD